MHKMTTPIGGYLELELAKNDFPHAGSTMLNTGRNCFEYILRANSCNHVYLPLYTCAVMLEPLAKLGIGHTFYKVDANLEIENLPKLQDGEMIIYTNYFGIKDAYSYVLAKRYQKQLILDCSQALYCKAPEECHTFYSPRKFIALPDGGCLVTTKTLDEEFPLDVSYDRMANLLRRIEFGAEADFEAYSSATPALKNQPIKRMSVLTRRLMENADLKAIYKKRLENFAHLHHLLGETNELEIASDEMGGALLYPYLTHDAEKLRHELLNNKILFARYWRNVLEWSKDGEWEYYLAKNLLPLPINQNYSTRDMQRIVDVIQGKK